MTKDGGSALDGSEKGTFPVRNPWSGDIAFTVSPAGAVELDRVVQAAKAAFRQFVKTPAHQRASWLNGAASAMEQASKSIIQEEDTIHSLLIRIPQSNLSLLDMSL